MNRKIAKLIDPYVSTELGFDVVQALSDMYTQKFFADTARWTPHPQNHTYSGWAIVDRVNELKPHNVLDYGCGFNIYKGKIRNLVGLDPFNPCADYQCHIKDMGPTQYDVIMCLGSLNFGDWEGILEEFGHLYQRLSTGGRMMFRVNAGQQWEQAPYIDIYEWSRDAVRYLSEKFGMDIVVDWCSDGGEQVGHPRYYFELQKRH